MVDYGLGEYGRYCVLDLSRIDGAPTPLPAWQGDLLVIYHQLDSARARADHEACRGNAFVVVVDIIDGRCVYPNSDSHGNRERLAGLTR
jgi:hypothetical protein